MKKKNRDPEIFYLNPEIPNIKHAAAYYCRPMHCLKVLSFRYYVLGAGHYLVSTRHFS